MQQIILNVEDSKAEIVLNIINNLKSDLIESCTLNETKDKEQEEIEKILKQRSAEDKEIDFVKSVTKI